MSAKLIAHRPDLKRLQDEGYEIEVRSGYLIVSSVPYLSASGRVLLGTVITDIDIALKPANHQVWFKGEHPCHLNGTPINALGAQPGKQTLLEGLEVDFRFSAKTDYPDYHSKISQYVAILEGPAKATNPTDETISARTFRPIETSEDESVFLYADSASSRAAIVPVTQKLAMRKVAIVGLGGTGSYILDLVSKTPVKEIHFFDKDKFHQHNAFRSPGAASLDDLKQNLSKVDYYHGIYSRMRRGLVPVNEYILEETLGLLNDFDFVFLCVDRPKVRKLITGHLVEMGIPFIDVGMELELIEEQNCLIGTCRVTLSSPAKNDHLSRHVPLGGGVSDDLYGTNIQVADLNCLNATLAVVKWKKYCDFYQDIYKEHQSAYAINVNQLTRDEMLA